MLDAGRIDEGIARAETTHQTYARLKRYEPAAGALRGAGFVTMAYGHLDKGAALAARTLTYAREVHLRFHEQLALMDLVGEAFARSEHDRCRELIAQSPGGLDLRGDLYRMWLSELAGDVDSAVRQMVSPERGGGATTALSQTHCANAGVLFHAGRLDAARQELDAWAEAVRQGNSFCEELAAISDCLVALGSDALLRDVQAALERDAARATPTVYCTLQGRAMAPARAAVALKLGELDAAERAYAEGLAWCEQQRVPVDAGRCHVGLADIARARGDREAAAAHVRSASAIFETHGARLWLDLLVAPHR
jgi:tetratricopeptide (TPR) repeat protein